jgi:hypothetical protein
MILPSASASSFALLTSVKSSQRADPDLETQPMLMNSKASFGAVRRAETRPSKGRRLRFRAAVFLCAGPLLLLGASLLGLSPWPLVNCRTTDVDVHTGRIRYARYLLWIRVHQSVEDSALTRALAADELAGTTPEWRRVFILSPGSHNSPTAAFQGAIGQIRELDSTWATANFTPAARRASARRVLLLWETTGTYHGARKYLTALVEAAYRGGKTAGGVDEADLPEM